MESNDTQSQQLQQLKQALTKYGRIIVVIVVTVAVLVFGANYWNKQRNLQFAAASQLYQDMVLAEMRQDSAEAKTKGATLLSDYDATPYAPLAGLLLAKIAITANDLDTAATKLHWVIDNSGRNNPAMYLATVRLSAVLQQQNKLDEALALVAKDPEEAYIPLYAQARGDIYTAKGDAASAREAYAKALQNLPQGTQAPLLQMKLLDSGGGEDNA